MFPYLPLHAETKVTDEVQERENVIKRDFSSEHPITKLLTDISEVQCSDGKLYISPIFDCYNGEIVALEMRDNMKKELSDLNVLYEYLEYNLTI